MPYRAFANQEYRNALQSWVEIPALLRALPITSGCRLLEVGCGRGVALTELARRCRPSRLAGIDIAPDLIALAQARLDHFGVSAELYVGDVRRLPFDDGDFDVVLDFGTCYHIDQPASALREIARVLDAGGVFIHELPLAQLIAHPVRSGGRRLPWSECGELTGERRVALWGSRRKAVVT